MEILTRVCGKSCWRMVGSSSPSAGPHTKSTSLLSSSYSRQTPVRPGSWRLKVWRAPKAARISVPACEDRRRGLSGKLPVMTAHTFAGPAQFGFRAGRRDADDKKATPLFHDVS